MSSSKITGWFWVLFAGVQLVLSEVSNIDLNDVAFWSCLAISQIWFASEA